MKKKHTAITCSTAASAGFLTHTHYEDNDRRGTGKESRKVTREMEKNNTQIV